jgi:hypothetical protein
MIILRCSNKQCSKLVEDRLLFDFEGTGSPVCVDCAIADLDEEGKAMGFGSFAAFCAEEIGEVQL